MFRPVPAMTSLLLAAPALAQWNPPAAQWGKVDARDVRVMSWNVQDALCSTNDKVEGANNWTACARTLAALRPDIVFLSECADNSGNGTGSGVDSVANLTAVIDDFLHGGTDSFQGNIAVTSWVQKYAPGYDLPYVYVSGSSDGFNRNVVLSRYPFADRNGDGQSRMQDIPAVTASAWAPGGNGGVRGFLFTEIDLPDAQYAGDLVFGGAHLKAGSTSRRGATLATTRSASPRLATSRTSCATGGTETEARRRTRSRRSRTRPRRRACSARARRSCSWGTGTKTSSRTVRRAGLWRGSRRRRRAVASRTEPIAMDRT